MIRVTVELIPGGVENHPRRRMLGKMEIANDATGDEETGNYIGTLHAEYTDAAGRAGAVRSFNRCRQSVWSLVGAFLKLWGHTKHSPSLMKIVGGYSLNGVTCDKCGGYVPGHATGAGDICTCEPIAKSGELL